MKNNTLNSTASMNTFYSYAIVEECIRNGIKLFCISPGHRSVCLAVAVASHPKARYKVFIDERGAAYFAVGHAMVSKSPAVLICTSGTALANYLPAVLEAYYSHTPLIILSADRPPELRETGANQTIDQVKIFSRFVYEFIDLPTPSLDTPIEFLLSTIDHFFSCAVSKRGPVHINCMFREPFLEDISIQALFKEKKSELPRRWALDHKPYTRQGLHIAIISQADLKETLQCIESSKNGLVVVGGLNIQNNRDTHEQLSVFLDKLGWPVYADVLSGGVQTSHVLSFGSHFLEDFTDSLDTILVLGERITSKKIQELISTTLAKNIIKITEYKMKSDPTHRVSLKIVTDLSYFLNKINSLMDVSGYSARQTLYHEKINKKDQKIRRTLEKLDRGKTWSSIFIVRFLEKKLNPDIALFSGNSMSIRLLDDYTSINQKKILIVANRGVSGIDGNIASALGFSETLEKPVCLLIGDLAFLHDLNSLNLLRSSSFGMLILLLNDNGGGIFSVLELSRLEKYQNMFKDILITPQYMNYMYAAKQFGLAYYSARDPSELETGYEQALENLKKKKSTLIEIILDQELNNKIVREINEKLKS